MAKQYGSNSPHPGDKINGKLEQGEYVMNRNVLAIPGMREYLDKLNYEVAPRYAQGGEVDGYALGGFVKSLFDKLKAPAGPTTAGDFDSKNMGATTRKMFEKDVATQPLKPQSSDEADFQDWSGRASDQAMSAGTSDEEDYQEAFGEPSITSKYMKEEATPDYMKDSLGSKLLSKLKKTDETVMDSPSEEELFFSKKYGSTPTPSEEPEADSGTHDPLGIFAAEDDYNPLAPEAPQKMGLKGALQGFGEKAGHFLEQNVQVPAIQAGIDAKQGVGNIHKYLGAGKSDKYEDVLTGKAKGSLYQRAGKGLGMLSSLASEFAAPGMGRGNLEGYGRYKGDKTKPTTKASTEATPELDPSVKPEDQNLDLDKDISKEIADRDKVVFEESVADDGVGIDFNEVGADTTAKERIRTNLHGGESTVNTGELTDESIGTSMSSESTSTSQDLDLSGGVEPELWTGSDIDYSLDPTEVDEEKAGGGLIHRAYQNGGYAHSNLDYMISLENHFQEGGMVSGNNSRRMFDFMKKRRY